MEDYRKKLIDRYKFYLIDLENIRNSDLRFTQYVKIQELTDIYKLLFDRNIMEDM